MRCRVKFQSIDRCFTKKHFGILPSAVEDIGTTMKLYTRKGRKKGQKLKYNKKKTVQKSKFNPSLKTVFIIHGFTESCKTKHHKKLRVVLLKAVSTYFIPYDIHKMDTVLFACAAFSLFRLFSCLMFSVFDIQSL